MAVLQMQRISICALKHDRKAILEKLQSMGMIEMHQVAQDEDGFEKMDTQSAKSSFEKRVQITENALDVLNQDTPEKKSMFASLEGNKLIDKKTMEAAAVKQEEVMEVAELLIADEPTTALDVTIQAQVLVMMKNLRDRLKTSMILITHDLGVVAQVCDKVAVMYAGEIIESGTLQDIYEGEKHHPYTVGLFGSIPQLDSETDRLSPIEGLMPDPTALPKGCSFAPRCPHACEACQQEKPGVYEEGTHRIKCILFSGEKDETGKGGAMR